jgi:hypothetical protein
MNRRWNNRVPKTLQHRAALRRSDLLRKCRASSDTGCAAIHGTVAAQPRNQAT